MLMFIRNYVHINTKLQCIEEYGYILRTCMCVINHVSVYSVNKGKSVHIQYFEFEYTYIRTSARNNSWPLAIGHFPTNKPVACKDLRMH